MGALTPSGAPVVVVVLIALAPLSVGCRGSYLGPSGRTVPRLPRSRDEWQRALSNIELGATEEEVRGILKRTVGYYTVTESNGSCPKMTRYWLTRDNVWQLRVGYTRHGEVGSHELFEHRFSDLRKIIGEELYPHVKLVHESHGDPGYEANPTSLIRAVNGLHALGRWEALNVLSAYVSMADSNRATAYDLSSWKVRPILRLLFVRKDGDPCMPRTVADESRTAGRSGDSNPWPLFPLALVHDVPFFLFEGTVDLRPQEDPARYVDYCAEHCRLRDRPLSPGVSPVRAANELMVSDRWKRLVAKVNMNYITSCVTPAPGASPEDVWRWLHASTVCGQALRALGSVAPVFSKRIFACYDWEEDTRAVERLRPRWSPEVQDFVATCTSR